VRELAIRMFGPEAIRDPELLQRLSSNLSKTSCFVAVGRSTFWALAEWTFVDARCIADIATDLLQQIGKPLHQNDLSTLISRRRPVNTRPIPRLLVKDTRFERTPPGTWALAR
jgi:hypothetical protein